MRLNEVVSRFSGILLGSVRPHKEDIQEGMNKLDSCSVVFTSADSKVY